MTIVIASIPGMSASFMSSLFPPELRRYIGRVVMVLRQRPRCYRVRRCVLVKTMLAEWNSDAASYEGAEQ